MDTCHNCGASRPPGAPPGHCPACLLGVALALGNGGSLLAAEFGVSEIAEEEVADLEPTTLPGRSLRMGDYEVLEELGRGGMGIVYRARQVRLNRLVALKVIRSGEMANELEVARFRAEAEAVAQLDHPNIVPIHEVGEDGGRHYFSMRLVDSENLAVHAQGSQVTPARAAELMAQVARAVHYAHQRGFLHRDLKPANILLDDAGKPYVTDLGLARRLGAENQITAAGAVLGTPSYMAPEQASGRAILTTAADVYSLGAILYELLAGRPPFEADTAMGTLLLARESEPLPPSVHRRDPAKSRPAETPVAKSRSHREVSSARLSDLDVITLKCLEKEPSHRYASAEALAEDLERWLRLEPIAARRTGPGRRLLQLAKRKPVVFGLCALLALAVVLGASGILWQWRQAVTARRGATELLREASIAQARAEKLTGLDGSRSRALAAIRIAAGIRPDAELRRIAVAAMSMFDLVDDPVAASPPALASPDIAFDAMLKHYATQLPDGRIVVGEVRTGREKLQVPRSASRVGYVALTPDGRYLGYRDRGSVVVWEVETRQLAFEVPLHPAVPLAGFEFHSRHPWLVVNTGTNALRILGVPEGEDVALAAIPWNPVYFRVSPEGSRVALAWGSACEVWDWRRQASIASLTNRETISATGWEPAGHRLALGFLTGGIQLWNPVSGDVASLIGELHEVYYLNFSPDGSLLLSSHDRHLSQLWDVATSQRLVHHSTGLAVRFSADGKSLGWRGPDGTVGKWRLQRPEGSTVLGGLPPGELVHSIAFSPDSAHLACALTSGMGVWSTGGRGTLEAFHKGDSGSWMTFASDGESILTVERSEFHEWPLRPGAEGKGIGLLSQRLIPLETARRLPLPEAGERGRADWFPRHYTAGIEGTSFRVVDRRNTERSAVLSGLPSGCSYSISPVANRVAICSSRTFIRDWSTGTDLGLDAGFSGGGVLFTADGSRVFHLGAAQLEILDAATGRRLFARPQEIATTIRPALSHDGRILALGGTSSSVVWLIDGTDGRELVQLTPPVKGQVIQMAFSPDDRTLAVSYGTHVRLWDLPGLRRQLGEMHLDW